MNKTVVLIRESEFSRKTELIRDYLSVYLLISICLSIYMFVYLSIFHLQKETERYYEKLVA